MLYRAQAAFIDRKTGMRVEAGDIIEVDTPERKLSLDECGVLGEAVNHAQIEAKDTAGSGAGKPRRGKASTAD